MSHTTASWDWKEGQTEIFREWNGRKWVIASVNTDLGWHEDAQCASRETASNARLIAAAPELLEALKAIAVANLGIAVTPTLESRAQNAALKKAHAAIAKAEGKS